MSVVRLWCPETQEDMEIWRTIARRFKPSCALNLSVLKRSAYKLDQADGIKMNERSFYSFRRALILRRRRS